MRRTAVPSRDRTPTACAVALALTAVGGLCLIPSSAYSAVTLPNWQAAYPTTTKLDLLPRGEDGIVLRGRRGPAGIQQFLRAPSRPFTLRLLNRGQSPVKVRLEWSRKGKVGQATEKIVSPGLTPTTLRFRPSAPSQNVLRVLVRLERGQSATLGRATLVSAGRNALKNSRLGAECSDVTLPGWRRRYADMSLDALPKTPGTPVVMRSVTGLAGIDQALVSPPRPFAVHIRGRPAGTRAVLIAEWSSGGRTVKKKRTRLVLPRGSQSIPLSPPRQQTGVQLQILQLGKALALQIDSVLLEGEAVGRQLVNPRLTVPECVLPAPTRVAVRHRGSRLPLYLLAAALASAGMAAFFVRRRRRP
jgi:hypothetical protein